MILGLARCSKSTRPASNIGNGPVKATDRSSLSNITQYIIDWHGHEINQE